MPDIKHLGYGSLTIRTGEDKEITFGPRETKDVSADDFDTEGIQKSLREGLIAVLPERAPAEKKPKPKPATV